MDNTFPHPPIFDSFNQAAQEGHLGNLLQAFATDRQRIRVYLRRENIFFLSCGLIFMGSVLISLLHYWPFYMWLFPLFWLLFTGILFLNTLNESWTWRKGAAGFVSLYEQGIIIALLFQGELSLNVVSWNQVLAIWIGLRKGALLSYIDADQQEQLLHVTPLIKDYPLLTECLQDLLTQRMLPRSQEALERGEACALGFLHGWDDHKVFVGAGFLITRQGLQWKDRHIPWAEVVAIEGDSQSGMICIRKRPFSPWVRVSARHIANAEVLRQLIVAQLEQRTL